MQVVSDVNNDRNVAQVTPYNLHRLRFGSNLSNSKQSTWGLFYECKRVNVLSKCIESN